MAEETINEGVSLRSVYTFTFGRNIYTIRLADIKKATLLEHVFSEREDDTEKVVKTLYIFSVVGNQIPGIVDDNNKPIYETVMEIKAEESDYSALYNIYEDLVIKWDKFLIETSVK